MELKCIHRWSCLPVIAFLGVVFGTGSDLRAEGIYRCVEGDGWVFQHTPCAPGAGAEFTLSPENRVGSPLRPSERRYVEDRVKEVRRTRSNIRSIGGDEGAAPRGSAKTCLHKAQALERVRRKLRQGYRPSRGESLRQRRDDLDEYLRRFCE